MRSRTSSPVKKLSGLLVLLWALGGFGVWLPNKKLDACRPELDSTQIGAIDYHLAQGILNYLPSEWSNVSKKKSKKKKGGKGSSPPIRVEIKHSIDLGLTKSNLIIDTGLDTGGLFDHEGNLLASIDEITEIARKKQGVHALFNDGSAPWKISTLSDNTDKPASLAPPLDETGKPTMVLGGFTMHRIVGDQVNPTTDTEAKLSAVKLFKGAKVLDTCCGLGYTAILAARRVGESGRVITIELDEASIEMCASNPWSKPLFDGSLSHLEVIQGNSCELVHCFEQGAFDAIVHDPPARAICETDLYSEVFYKALKSRLKAGGQLFHYIGSPTSTESGRLYAGITDRLRSAGFSTVEKFPAAFGLVARA